ncbi:hypothetical protein [Streptomyces sp. NPDC048200]|uniref:hypothetical protein n=1 Tax=Streptomyces sp. NPDC048200 TaxID=3365512 RepID=UPI0037136487
MNWAQMAGTVVGATIGVVSALTLEHARWRRGAKDRHVEALRAAYTAYLSALSQVAEQIWQASRAGLSTPEEAAQKAHAAFGDHEVFARRYELLVVVPSDIAPAVDDVIWKLVRWGDQVIAGGTHDLPECDTARITFNDARNSLIVKMRHTLPSLPAAARQR